MNTSNLWVLCWTQTKNTLHIEQLETHLSLNCQSFLKNLSGDYRVLQIGTRAEVEHGMRQGGKTIDDRGRERVRPPRSSK